MSKSQIPQIQSQVLVNLLKNAEFETNINSLIEKAAGISC